MDKLRGAAAAKLGDQNRPLIISQPSGNSSNSGNNSADVSGIRNNNENSSASSSFIAGGQSFSGGASGAQFKSSRQMNNNPSSGLNGGASTRTGGAGNKSTKSGVAASSTSTGTGRRSKKKKRDDFARVIDKISGRDVTPMPLTSSGGGSQPMNSQQLAQFNKQNHQNLAQFSNSSFVEDFNSMDFLSSGGSDSDREDGNNNGNNNQFSDIENSKFNNDEENNNENNNNNNNNNNNSIHSATTVSHQQQQPREWSDKELRERITIKIEETETHTLLYIPGIKIWGENEKWTQKILLENENYRESIEKHKEKDKFLTRSAQTINENTRDKEIQINPPVTKSIGIGVNTYDIYDEYQLQLNEINNDNNNNENNNNNNENNNNKDDELDDTSNTNRLSSMDKQQNSRILSANSSIRSNNNNNSANQSKSNFSSQIRIGSATRSTGAGGDSVISNNSSDKSGIDSMNNNGNNNNNTNNNSGSAVVDEYSDEFQRFLQSSTLRSTMKALEESIIQNELFDEQLYYRNFNNQHNNNQQNGSISVSFNDFSTIQNQLLNNKESKEGESIEQQLMMNNSSGLNHATHQFLNSFLSGDQNNNNNGNNNNDNNNQNNNSTLNLLIGSNNNNHSGLRYLWSFQCELTHNRPVSCMSWNKQNTDLLAVGYGNIEFQSSNSNNNNNNQQQHLPGLICFWSLKNPNYPQKIIQTGHSVTALDFCTEHPHLLAAGLYDGSVCIYDIRDHTRSIATVKNSNELPHGSVNINGQHPHIKYDKPALESSHSTGKHSEPVWGVKWVNKESMNKSRIQILMSISSDGTIKQWSHKKGLIPHELMQLKRIQNRATLFSSGNNSNQNNNNSTNNTTGNNNNNVNNTAIATAANTMEGISREASGMCFDFPFHDGTQYYAGTEDGIIHKCSISYNEQTLENYFTHTGPVYKIRCSPYLPDAFISCSADWSSALWSQKYDQPILKFQSGHDYILDCIWSPANSCVFGLVSRDGKIEIWDIENSPLDPIILLDTKLSLTSLLFSPNTPVVMAGSMNGEILVYRMEGIEGNWNSPYNSSNQNNSSNHHHNNNNSNSMEIHSDHELPSGLYTAANQRWNFEDQAARLDEVLYSHAESRNKLSNVTNSNTNNNTNTATAAAGTGNAVVSNE